MNINRIGESELIITERGTVYHLDIAPHEIANIIITVGDPNRVATISNYFDVIEMKRSHREFVTHTGWFNNMRISVIGTGIGPDNIDIVLNEVDALVNIDFATRLPNADFKQVTILRIGTSGALQPDIPLDSWVCASYGIGLDNLLHYYKNDFAKDHKRFHDSLIEHLTLDEQYINPYITVATPDWVSKFNDKEGYIQGMTVTSPGFYAPQGRILRLPLAYPNLINELSSFKFENYRITNFEMETAAIYGLATLMGHKCISLNTIIANRSLNIFSKDIQKSVSQLIEHSLLLLTNQERY